jgi:hypothetical protein
MTLSIRRNASQLETVHKKCVNTYGKAQSAFFPDVTLIKTLFKKEEGECLSPNATHR